MIFIADGTDRLDKFLARVLPDHSRTKLTKIINEEKVLVNGKKAKASLKLEPGMSIELDEPEEAEIHDLSPADIPLDVVYEDEFLLVVNKPRGLASHPAATLKQPSLVNALLGRNITLSGVGESYRPGIVHRLDKETTGLMVVAKTDAAHVSLAKQMESKSAERRYVANVAGEVTEERFKVDAPIGRNKVNRVLMAVDPEGKHALTHCLRVARLEHGTLVAVRLETGRTHQIRVHLRAIGHPVLGDKLYAPKEYAKGELQLHAGYLAFDHPETGERVETYCDPPFDFEGASMVSLELLKSV